MSGSIFHIHLRTCEEHTEMLMSDQPPNWKSLKECIVSIARCSLCDIANPNVAMFYEIADAVVAGDTTWEKVAETIHKLRKQYDLKVEKGEIVPVRLAP